MIHLHAVMDYGISTFLDIRNYIMQFVEADVLVFINHCISG